VPDKRLVDPSLDNGLPIHDTIFDLCERLGYVRHPVVLKENDAAGVQHAVEEEFTSVVALSHWSRAALSRLRTVWTGTGPGLDRGRGQTPDRAFRRDEVRLEEEEVQ